MSVCLIGLGSNLGDRQQALDGAVARLAEHSQLRLAARSSWRETAPIGGPGGQAPCLNGAALLETSLSPPRVLEVLRQVESELGRRRNRRWAPRRIDLDLLLYDLLLLKTSLLELPHPRMAWRRFVLQPAAEIAGAMIHPTIGWSVARLLAHLDTTAPYVAITGSIGAGKTHLCRRVAERISARRIAEPLDLAQLEAFYADPPSLAWQTEIQFLNRRAELLAAGAAEWTGGAGPAVSDFWFDQSWAFARVWLPAERHAEFRRRWEQSRNGVVRPRLIVLLEVPAETLAARIRRRGRHCERALAAEQLAEIGRSIAALAAEPDQGPVLRLACEDPDRQLDEVAAAAEAMQ